MSDSLRLCPACGTPVADGAAFCDACGAELHAEGAEKKSHAEFAEVKSHAEFAEKKSHAESAENAESAESAANPLLATVEAVLTMRRAAAAAPAQRAPIPVVPAVPAKPELPSEPAVSLHSVSSTLVLAKPAAPVRPVASAAPASPASVGSGPAAGGALRADPAEDVPFELEWDEARSFIEGRAGQLAFRFKPLCNLAKAGVRAVVNGEDAGVQLFSSLQAGRTREGLFDIEPDRPGAMAVQLRVETLLDGRTHEIFEAERGIEHTVYSATRQEVQGAGGVTINYAPNVENNSGIARLDDVRISAPGAQGFRVDHWKEMDGVLGRRGRFVRVGFAPVSVSRENVRFRATGAALDELLVVPGADTVSFGKSASRADVRLAAETPDGESDEARAGFVSGVHFSIRRDRACETFSIVDGGPSKDDPKKWCKSTNGLAIDGELADGPRTLPAGRRLSVTLAPYVVSGGALPLELWTRGWDDPAAAGCTGRAGNLSSVLVRRLDNPRKAVLVVWGAAALDPVLGTKTGQRVVSLDGRLHLADEAGRVRRLTRLAGTVLPCTPYTVR